MKTYSKAKIKTELDIINNFVDNYFPRPNFTRLLGHYNIDLILTLDNDDEPIIIAEAKSKPTDISTMFTQLIFTFYKAQHYIENPKLLCVFDNKQVAFIPFSSVAHLYNEKKTVDFDGTVTPSNRNTKEFKIIEQIVKNAIDKDNILFQNETLFEFKPTLFYFDKNKNELKEGIKEYIRTDQPTGPKDITDQNFSKVYYRGRDEVMPTISVDGDAVRNKYGILDCDYYLADLFSKDNLNIDDKLYVLLKSDHYKVVNEAIKAQGELFHEMSVYFKDKQASHTRFGQRYIRPPAETYGDLILKRRDLLVPQDIRQRLGAFFTPPQGVKLSQQYMHNQFGDLKQYCIGDCTAGTGNLLQGLEDEQTNYNLFASDINVENVYVMKGRVAANELNMPEAHIFQFDFLNDDFDKLPQPLINIIKHEPERLIIYINPPYAEAGSTYFNDNKPGVTTEYMIHKKYSEELGKARNELFALFLMRIKKELQCCKIGNFAKLKVISASNFATFRQHFLAEFKGGFLVPANTFDNVKGQFPIAFQIGDTAIEEKIKDCEFDVYDKNGSQIGTKKRIYDYDGMYRISKWIREFEDKVPSNRIGGMNGGRVDFQNQNLVFIVHHLKPNSDPSSYYGITKDNLIPSCIYLAVRKVVPVSGLNDREQFLYPNDNWKDDTFFHSDCLAYTLFHSSNNIQSRYGINHWIPFTEAEVGSKHKFSSSFMVDYISGKKRTNSSVLGDSFGVSMGEVGGVMSFSPQAQALFTSGLALWSYYHRVAGGDVDYINDASYYDIRRYFQGVNADGKMNLKCRDELRFNDYNRLVSELRSNLKRLGDECIVPKVYEYGFLLK